MKTCRYCSKPIPFPALAEASAYWNATKDFCHRSCKAAGERQEAFDCQCIDADCNDCKHYQRGKIAPKTISSYIDKRNGKLVTIIHQPDIFVGGSCAKFNLPTLAFPKKWTGRECFEHRKKLTTPD